MAALDEARRRGLPVGAELEPREVTLPSPLAPPRPAAPSALAAAPDAASGSGYRIQARQVVGQPAGPGLAIGPARVVLGRDDVTAFEDGDVLVCDAVQPEMTFVVPLAAGIVERRGGMLIHGAIIAREYGLPCVTGVPRATELVRTGDRVTVDGYLGHRRHRLIPGAHGIHRGQSSSASLCALRYASSSRSRAAVSSS